MKNLIRDIKIYLNDNLTIRGFDRKRLEDLCASELEGIQGYEIRFLINWSGLYLYQFESTYEISINDL